MRIETAARCARPITVPSSVGTALLPIDLFAGSPELIGSPFSYSREEEIYGEGEEAEFVYRIVRGAVRTCKILGDGRRQINGFYLPGDLFGFEQDERHRLTAEAVADTKVVMFRRRQLERLATRNVDVACQLWSMTANELRHAEEHMLLLGRKSAMERVANFLLEMDRRLAVTGMMALPMCRRDIGDYLGLTLETVSRALSQLHGEGVLVFSGARQIVLRNRQHLRNMDA